jgi:hypothetical protein
MSIRGGYSGGLLFRLQNGRGYLFEVGIGGAYHIGNWGAPGSFQDWTNSSAIQQGLNSLNILQVIAHGSDLRFYVNGMYLTQVKDATYALGDIGLICEANTTTGPGEAVFSNLHVYL